MNVNILTILIFGIITVAGIVASLFFLVKRALVKPPAIPNSINPWIKNNLLFFVGLYLSTPLLWGRISWLTPNAPSGDQAGSLFGIWFLIGVPIAIWSLFKLIELCFKYDKN